MTGLARAVPRIAPRTLQNVPFQRNFASGASNTNNLKSSALSMYKLIVGGATCFGAVAGGIDAGLERSRNLRGLVSKGDESFGSRLEGTSHVARGAIRGGLAAGLCAAFPPVAFKKW